MRRKLRLHLRVPGQRAAAGAHAAHGQVLPHPHAGAKNAPLLSTFYIKVIGLPRQARDKHRENSKRVAFFAGYAPRLRWQPVRPRRYRKNAPFLGPFLRPLCINAILLPRQAQDKQKETLRHQAVLSCRYRQDRECEGACAGPRAAVPRVQL